MTLTNHRRAPTGDQLHRYIIRSFSVIIIQLFYLFVFTLLYHFFLFLFSCTITLITVVYFFTHLYPSFVSLRLSTPYFPFFSLLHRYCVFLPFPFFSVTLLLAQYSLYISLPFLFYVHSHLFLYPLSLLSFLSPSFSIHPFHYLRTSIPFAYDLSLTQYFFLPPTDGKYRGVAGVEEATGGAAGDASSSRS